MIKVILGNERVFKIINSLFLISIERMFSIKLINVHPGERAFEQIDITQMQVLGKSVLEMKSLK